MDKGLAHSHITGLGIDRTLSPIEGSGLYGMELARQAASLFADLITAKKTAGSILLITGPSGAGKTALAVGLSRELGTRVPFVRMSGSELFSAEIKTTELLQQALRRATLLRIREIKSVYEGEVTDIQVEEREDPLNNYRKTVARIDLRLKSAKGSQLVSLDPISSQEIAKQRITVGDVVHVETASGAIKKLGRCDAYASEFDIESTKYVPLPKGDVLTRKETLQEMSLHEIDAANAFPRGTDAKAILGAVARGRRFEVPARVREEVNARVAKQIVSGAAEITPGLLFIDECHSLDEASLGFLVGAAGSSSSPAIVLATNRELNTLPASLRRTALSVPVSAASPEVMPAIIRARGKSAGLDVSESVVDTLSSLAQSTSLRHALSIMALAALEGSLTPETITATSQVFSAPSQ
ncbi:RuvB-like protein 1 [Nematocida homosporus]|uniref:RuvB-like protein 1 n=1 Tax=Nematocida homosporus TaxID=1912981 RepID=UPI0022200644|nr:RuvB-like protein 1 [Nematocida homosporus]KAI5186261.1 RuvB-like protein 1 [Nematocida homosporus]